ncbi:dTMP kinase [Candidatus Phytoplasma pruni]|uniref:Thymidylate kinase n=1 Tax=Candidatus Phytoplasma pruni TaxID=479893 RepID=A0A851H9Z3_9MOLU|nr:dTMP kinase [Candidatus Phytoplasma pruni]NWN45762.1 dTMP kinase [Candidatus Phytoplasma pruni]
MKLIVLEGIDGCGKTSLIRSLQHELTQQGAQVILGQGLGSSSLGKEMRQIFLHNPLLTSPTRYLLSFANMLQTQEELIKPHLHQPTIILMDRWVGSNFAYQVYPHSTDPTHQKFNLIHQDFYQPDLTVYIDIEPEIGLKRKQIQPHHKTDVIEEKPLSYFHQVRQGYYQYLEKYQPHHHLFLSGTTTIEENTRLIIQKINQIKEQPHD